MSHNRSWIGIFALALSMATGIGCQSSDTDEQTELQALLHDEPLQQVPPGAAARTADGPAVASPAGSAGAMARTGKARAAAIRAAASSGPPVGAWNFDDCSPASTLLNDATFSLAFAFRAVNAACVDGIQGQGIAI